ncbi:hypothetical protein [Ruegeria atlantica]|uniref:hypothetical protein n=1 Tax=Ruegeria atlantica TaxID=81569 RepID=UPI00147EFC0A|nr:hypothetical protein [Ruegeria atlantica]
MKILQTVMLCILTVACSVAALFLYLLWSMKKVTVNGPAGSSSYTLDMLAINITILEIVLALVGFIVAALGVIGYAGIKTAAIDAAEKEAKRVADEQMRLYSLTKEGTQTGLSEHPGGYSGADAPIDSAVPASEGE